MARFDRNARYEPIRGDKLRRARDARTGDVISHRQYETWQRSRLLPPEAPPMSLEGYRQMRAAAGIKTHMGHYNAVVRDYRVHMRQQGRTVRNARTEVQPLIGLLKSDNMHDKRRALVRLGRRNPLWDFPVGESPDWAKGKVY